MILYWKLWRYGSFESQYWVSKNGKILIQVSITVGGFIILLINFIYTFWFLIFERGIETKFILRLGSGLILIFSISVLSKLSFINFFQLEGIAVIRPLYLITVILPPVVSFNLVCDKNLPLISNKSGILMFLFWLSLIYLSLRNFLSISMYMLSRIYSYKISSIYSGYIMITMKLELVYKIL